MKIDNRPVIEVTVEEAIAFAASYAISEAVKQEALDEALAQKLLDRMNILAGGLLSGKIVSWNRETKEFDLRELSEATLEEGDTGPTPDVLVINGE